MKSKHSVILLEPIALMAQAGVTPIRKLSDSDLYDLNTALDGDKDWDTCEQP